MDKELIKSKVLKFLKSHNLCVISTTHADGSGPEAAVIAFAQTDNLELIFGTSNQSRKYKNFQKDNRAAFAIGWDTSEGTIQYQGVVNELGGEEARKYASIQIAKNPTSGEYLGKEDQRWFLVKPTWIRFVDNQANPPITHELSF